jgi:hypothetical protein
MTPAALGILVASWGTCPLNLASVRSAFLHVIDEAAREGLLAAERLLAHYQNYNDRTKRRLRYSSLVNQRPDGSVVIEQPAGTRAVYRKIEQS